MRFTPLVLGRGAYVPVVRLVRQIREHHLGESKPGGLYLELATYWTFDEGVSGDCFAALLSHVLDSLKDKLSGYAIHPLIDPALGSPYEPRPDSGDLFRAAEVFGTLARQAAEALTADRCQAAVLWRKIIGENERGPGFPIPEGCDDRGRVIPPVRANTGRGSDEARGFGCRIDF